MTLGVEKAAAFVGRDAERSLFSEALADVRAGASRVVLVEGEAGIGKSRLVQEVIADAGSSGFTVLHGGAEELERARAFGGVADALRRFAGELPSAGKALEQLVRSDGPTSDVALLDAFVDLVEELALSRPACVVMEDLHWADAATLAGILGVSRRLAYLPVLLIGTYRPHPQSQALARLIGAATQEHGVELRLEPLAEDEIASLTEGLIGARPGPNLLGLIASARGNPLYVTEIARAVLQDQELDVRDAVADVTTMQLPPTLRLTILRRISFLPAESLDLLKQTAILGSSFPLDEFLAVTGDTVDKTLQRLSPAIAARIVEAEGSTISFRHDLIHESIYQDIPAPHRAAMHNHAARALRSSGSAVARVAEHFLRGLDLGVPELFEDAIAFASEIRFRATPLAVAVYEKAIELPGVPADRRLLAQQEILYPLISIGRVDDAERLANEVVPRATDAGSIRWAWVIAEAKMRKGRARESIPVLEGIIADPRADGWTYYVVRALLAAAYMRTSNFGAAEEHAAAVVAKGRARDIDSPARFRGEGVDYSELIVIASGLITLAPALLARGEISQARALADEVLDIHRRIRTPIPLLFAIAAQVYLDSDDLAGAQAFCREGLQMDRESGIAGLVAPYGGFHAFVGFHAGAWDEAAAEAKTSVELVRDGSDSTDVLFGAHVALAQIDLHRGRTADAGRQIGWMDDFITDHGPQWGMIPLAWTKAMHLDALGRSPEALAVLIQAWDAYASCRYIASRPVFADLVRMAIEAGDRDRAEGVAAEAERGAQLAPEVHSAAAVARQSRGLVDDDPDALIAAVEAYRETPRIVERSRACEDAAGSLIRRGKLAEARAFLEEGLAFYESVHAAHDVRRITAAVRDAGIRRGARGKRARPKTGWGALTDAEQQVARLTVEGLTNPQIAERLFVSKHTVQTHLSHVFAKLGISSRAALAGIAAEKAGGPDRSNESPI
ncbi:MAG: AAA family ATPase [Actinomycetota bacterium]